VEQVKIYTKTGDQGETSLRWGQRTAKDALRVEAYGSVDEANAFIGLAVAHLGQQPDTEPITAVRAVLVRVQRELFDVGADLAAPPEKEKGGRPKVAESHVAALEADIDRFDVLLPTLRNFILPGGTQAAAAVHVARTVCRRAERRVVTLMRQEPVDGTLLRYLNRLSDLLFVLGRLINQEGGTEELPVIFAKT
jgi:cob(I)alamin adenosyltransferase